MAVELTPSAPVPAFGPFHVPAFGRPKMGRLPVIGIIGALFFVQIFIWLGTVIDVNSQGGNAILPGNWSGESNFMLFYIASMLFAMILIGYTTDLSLTPKRSDISRFMINYSLWTFITWGALTLIYPSGSGAIPLLGTSRLQQFIITSLFVAPTEELLFRVVFPRVTNSWVIGSVVLFSFYHVPAYFLNGESQGQSLVTILVGLGSVALLGIVLWFIYSFVFTIKTKRGTISINSGYGGSTGFHSAWDLFTLGVLSKFPVGLVPI